MKNFAIEVKILYIKTVKSGSTPINISDAIYGDNTIILVRFIHRLHSLKYQCVLDEGLSKVYDNESIFIQDGVIGPSLLWNIWIKKYVY